MQELIVKSVLTGICWGIWPLIMNKSGLGGNASSLFFIGIMLVVVYPFTIGNIGNTAGVNWWFVVIASILGGVGTLLFNGMLAKSTAANVGLLIVITFVLEIAISAVYKAYIDGLTLKQGIGFVCAIASAILLTL